MAKSTKKKSTDIELVTKSEDIILDLLNSCRKVRTKDAVYVHIEEDGEATSYELFSEELKSYLKTFVKDQCGHFPADITVRDCLHYVSSKAKRLPVEETYYRVAIHDGEMIYDLQNGKYVVVNKSGWKVVERTDRVFMHSFDGSPQVTPVHCTVDDGISRLDKYLNISQDEKLLLKVYLVACFNDSITFPSININGTNGSGKSTLSRIIKKIIDPSQNELEILPDSQDNLRVRLNVDYYLAFDNISTISKNQSDFLCSAITGVSITKRKTYSNNKLNTVQIKRGICLNGISQFIKRADLSERTIFITTKLIQGNTRIGDIDFWESFSKDLPYILGGIFSIYSKALRIYPTVKLPHLQRLADFNKFGYAVAEAMGGLGDEFNRVLDANKETQMEVTCDNALLVDLVPDFLREYDGEWTSDVTFFYKSLKNFMEEELCDDEYKYNAAAFPNAPNYLSRGLHAYESALASKGVRFDIKKNSKGNKDIHLTMTIRTPIMIGRTPILSESDLTKIQV